MNPVLREIIDTGLVRTADGLGPLPLHSNVSVPQRETLVHPMVSSLAPTTSLEVGLAYGVSALWICEARVKSPTPGTSSSIPINTGDRGGTSGRGHRARQP